MLKMKYLVTALMALAVTAALLLPAGPSHAQEAQNIPVAIGIVDMQTVFEKSAAGQSLRKQAEALRDKIRGDLAAQEKALRAEGDKLNAARVNLSQADFQKQAQDLQARMVQLRKQQDEKRRGFEKSYNEAQKTITQTMYKVIGQVAVERKLTLVLNKTAAIVSASAWDISDTVLKQLNAALPSVKM